MRGILHLVAPRYKAELNSTARAPELAEQTNQHPAVPGAGYAPLGAFHGIGKG
nr:MAG TPA: hypothetical protein [Caudoviricetes sp.]